MRDPQFWTLIGVLATLMFAMHRLTIREMAARFDAQDAKFEGRFDRVDARFDGLERVMEAKFTDVDHRLGALEADVSLIKASLINQRSA